MCTCPPRDQRRGHAGDTLSPSLLEQHRHHASRDHTTLRSDASLAEAVANTLQWHSALTPVLFRQPWTRAGSRKRAQWRGGSTKRRPHVPSRHGVKGVSNGIIVQPKADAGDVKAKI